MRLPLGHYIELYSVLDGFKSGLVMKNNVFSSLIVCAAVMGSGAAHADPVQMLQAYSTTALAITGDITIDGTSIRFATGQGLPLKVAAQQDQTTLFEVGSTANPVLLNGNTLCGNLPVTYIIRRDRDDLVLLSMFDTAPPASDQAIQAIMATDPFKGTCAVFTYLKD